MDCLSRNLLATLNPSGTVLLPDASTLELPEKVLQFGTGVLLRALPDHFIDKANQQKLFNGSIVVIRSTGGSNADFESQDGLYTVCERGLQEGTIVNQNSINASISRVLSASSQWQEILQVARSKDLQLIISNTTEVGIRFDKEMIGRNSPSSFPAKLLAVLKTRYDHFKGEASAGLVIIPTELITNNGTVLKGILLKLAILNEFGSSFIDWLTESNVFCNSLVDRIVPGKPVGEEWEKTTQDLGYTDALLTKAEPFKLWAIEGDEQLRKRLPFSQVDPGIIITEDITKFKELKLRLLNGTHSFCCAVAYLCNISFTRETFADPVCSSFINRLMFEEIVPAIPYEVSREEKETYAHSVIDRFANPFIDHQWISISVQYTSKMRLRNVPLIQQYHKLFQTVPPLMSFGFASYILFLRPSQLEDNRYFGDWEGITYEIKDEAAPFFYDLWRNTAVDSIAQKVLMNTDLWGVDLSQIKGLAEQVQTDLKQILSIGLKAALVALLNEKRA